MQKEINIKKSGVTMFGFPLGFAPTARDFDLAVEGEDVRFLQPLNERQLKISDSCGLSWLVDLKHDFVLWFDILLAKPSHRPRDDHDPQDVFKYKIHIDQYTVQGPFSIETGEVVRRVVIPSLGIRLVPSKKHIRAVNVAFMANESLLRQ